MHVIDVLEDRLETALGVLDELIRNYDDLDDTTRIDKARTIFQYTISYLSLHRNLLRPQMDRQRDLHADMLAHIDDLHGRIDYVLEHSQFIHVDEPRHEFYNRMVQLKGLLEGAASYDRDRILPWYEHKVPDTVKRDLDQHIQEQLTHESLPSSGLTIY